MTEAYPAMSELPAAVVDACCCSLLRCSDMPPKLAHSDTRNNRAAWIPGTQCRLLSAKISAICSRLDVLRLIRHPSIIQRPTDPFICFQPSWDSKVALDIQAAKKLKRMSGYTLTNPAGMLNLAQHQHQLAWSSLLASSCLYATVVLTVWTCKQCKDGSPS